MQKFILLTTLLILSRVCDAFTTYLYIPDLKKELNPLVSLLGWGWTGLIISQMIFLAIFSYCIWVYCFKKVNVEGFRKSISLTQFMSLFHFNDTKSFAKFFYKLPKNKNSLAYSFGYIGTFTLMSFSFIVSFSTFLLLISKEYRLFYSAYYVPVFLYIFAVIIAALFTLRFYKRELQLRAT